MRTLFQSTVRGEVYSPTPEGASWDESYGGENLPVLLRLPDLSNESPGMPAASEAFEGRERGTPVAEPSASAERTPDEEQTSSERSSQETTDSFQRNRSSGQDRRQRHQRRSRRDQSNRQTASSRGKGSGWLRGTGQFAFAAVLAGLLLAGIIAIKSRQAPEDSEPGWVDQHPSLEASKSDGAEPPRKQAAEAPSSAGSDLLLQMVAGHETAAPKRRETGGSTARDPQSSDQSAGQRLTAYDGQQTWRGSESVDEAAGPNGRGGYPSTGAGPVIPAREPAERGDIGQSGSRWPDTVPNSPVRSADRNPPSDYQRR